jgi:hypothetical protein
MPKDDGARSANLLGIAEHQTSRSVIAAPTLTMTWHVPKGGRDKELGRACIGRSLPALVLGARESHFGHLFQIDPVRFSGRVAFCVASPRNQRIKALSSHAAKPRRSEGADAFESVGPPGDRLRTPSRKRPDPRGPRPQLSACRFEPGSAGSGR